MTFIICKNGIQENRIVADEAFCQQCYSSGGYSYELEPELEKGPTEKQVSETDQLRADVDYIAAMTGITL